MGRKTSAPVAVALVLAMGLVASAQDNVNQQALSRVNEQLATLWRGDAIPLINDAVTEAADGVVLPTFQSGNRWRTAMRIAEGLQMALGNTVVHSGSYRIEFGRLNVNTNLEAPPGLERLDMNSFSFALPLRSAWSIEASTRVTVCWRHRIRVGPIRITISFRERFNLWLTVSDIRAVLSGTINSTNPDRPVLSSITPTLNCNVRLDSGNFIVGLLLEIIEPRVRRVVRERINEVIANLGQQLNAFIGRPTLHGTGGPQVTDSGHATDFLTPALYISNRIQRYCIPYGSLVGIGYATPYYGTWQEAAAQNLDFGAPHSYNTWGDSAIWSGHYLAAEAFRYATTQDPVAAQNARTILNGLTHMIHMRGVPGLLNRAMRPHDVYPADPTNTQDQEYVVNYQGRDWVACDFISRDQYLGVLLGTVLAHEFIPELRQQAGSNIEAMLGYLLANNWTARKRDGSISTVWVLNAPQQIAWLLAGVRANSARFLADYNRERWLADLAWFSVWTTTFDQHLSYFKYNLSHGALFVALRYERDPVLWQRLHRALRILRAAVGHHQNAYFNLVNIGSVPGTNPALAGETRELLRLWLRRPMRAVPQNLQGIELVWHTPLGSERAIQIARYPIPVDRRIGSGGDFLWQRSPFFVGIHSNGTGMVGGGGNGTEEQGGVDYILPYWMARYFGVIQ